MSITKSYNKQTDTYYAYETTYEWSDEKQKKIQRKKCIGQFDPNTGKVIPNGKVGRPSISRQLTKSVDNDSTDTQSQYVHQKSIGNLVSKLNRIEETLRILSSEVQEFHSELISLSVKDSRNQ